MSDAQGSYKLDEAQAVLRETKAIKKAITCGEKEKQDLIKVRSSRDGGSISVSPGLVPHATQITEFSPLVTLGFWKGRLRSIK